MSRRPRTKIELQMDPETQKILYQEVGLTARKVLDVGEKIADRTIQASLSSPYFSWAAIALLCAMGVRANLWSSDTSNLVTGTGLALMGGTAIATSIPLLSGVIKTESLTDNKWDQSQVLSPWAIEVQDKSALDSFLVRASDNV